MVKLILFQSKINGLIFLKQRMIKFEPMFVNVGFFSEIMILVIFFFIIVAAIIFSNKEAIDQGFCHLQKVKIQVLLDCNLNYTSTVTIALAQNESDTSGNYILQCVWVNGKSMNCLGDSDETGEYNGFNDILEIEFIFNDNKHSGLYLRITTDCNASSIALTPCREFLRRICSFRFGNRTDIYLIFKQKWGFS